MTRTINLSNTQFRYQIVFFIHVHGYISLAEGCHWHLLPRQNFTTIYIGKTCGEVLPRQKMPMATFSQPYITIHVYEKDYLIPKLCIR